MYQALLYSKLRHDNIRCLVCERRCLITPGKSGFCQTRINQQGKLYTLIYGVISSLNVDPIEKKPVFHYQPGSQVLSLGTYGCNFRCRFCQNWDISFANASELKMKKEKRKTEPEEIIALAQKYQTPGIALTYNEPAIWLEYSLDVFRLAKQSHTPGLNSKKLDDQTGDTRRGTPKKGSLYGFSWGKARGRTRQSNNPFTIWVTNGYATKEALDLIAPYLDIYRVDLKSFDDSFYQKLISVPKAKTIFDNTLYLHQKYPHIHLECITNIIPGWNDQPQTLKAIACWIKKNLGPKTPWHVTRFFPAAKMQNLPPTPPETLIEAQKIGFAAGLEFVYLGNMTTAKGENTYCPKCRTLNIERSGYTTQVLAVTNRNNRGFCRKCNEDLNLFL